METNQSKMETGRPKREMGPKTEGLIATSTLLAIAILIYLLQLGGDKHILLTDILVVIYSFLAVIAGIFAIKIYSLKSIQGRTLFLILLGVISWSLAELMWFISAARYYSEFLRFLGYVPFIIAFFTIPSLSDPSFRQKRKKIIYLLAFFLVLAVVYLNIIPIVFGGTSLLENILNNGYIVVDFVLLFGIFLLLRASYAFKKGLLSFGWLIIALAFIPVFAFDVYFAFTHQNYFFGNPFEVLWLFNYLLLAYGFFYQYQTMRDFLEPIQSKITATWRRKVFIATVIAIFTSLVSLFLLFSYVFVPSFYISDQIIGSEQLENYQEEFAIEYREDFSIVFTPELVDAFNQKYHDSAEEYLFCLLGKKVDNIIYVDNLTEPEIHLKGSDIIISKDDPSCQIENAVGSIHSHTHNSCKPSQNDLFSWGEMRNPEPIINAIHCNDTIYIVLMPGEHEGLDFRALRWKIEG